MNKYPYIWYLNYISNYKINLNEYNPYQELYYENNVAHINSYKIQYNLSTHNDILEKQIKIISKISNLELENPLNLSIEKGIYHIEKYKYKKKYIKDYIYLFVSCISDIFENSVIYLDKKENKFIIFLDTEKTEERINIMNNIIDNFLELNFKCIYSFSHIYKLDIKEFSKLGRWLLL